MLMNKFGPHFQSCKTHPLFTLSFVNYIFSKFVLTYFFTDLNIVHMPLYKIIIPVVFKCIVFFLFRNLSVGGTLKKIAIILNFR